MGTKLANSPSNQLAKESARTRGLSATKTSLTRRRIFDAALDMFLAHGFENAKMGDIARAASVAKGTLYLYFASKDALFEAVLADTVSVTMQTLSSVNFEHETNVQAFLRATLLPFANQLKEPRRAALFRLIVTEGPRFPSLLATYQHIVLTPIQAVIRRLAARARETGEIQSDALLKFPILMLSPGLLSTLWNGLFPDDFLEPVELFDAFFALIFQSPNSEPR